MSRAVPAALRRSVDNLSRSTRSLATNAAPQNEQRELFIEKPFVGSVPLYPTHLVIHSPEPSQDWPALFGQDNTLLGLLNKRARRWRGLVNQSSDPTATNRANGKMRWSQEYFKRGKDPTQMESFFGTLYRPPLPPLAVGPFAMSRRGGTPEYLGDITAGRSPIPDADKYVHIYVCTHGARDCRCGTTGGEVFEAMKKATRGMDHVVVRETTHVGGHQ